MKLIVGLGNPGEKYEQTRHNLGFRVVDHLFQKLMPAGKTVWSVEKKWKSEVATVTVNNAEGAEEKIILLKPQTFMNDSGEAVQLVASFYHIEPSNIWITYDEVDLPVGTLRIRFGGAAAGHHGVESIMEKLGTDAFWRARLGIGESMEQKRDVSDFVLGTFSQAEHGKVRELIKHASDALAFALEKDLHAAMNKFNTK